MKTIKTLFCVLFFAMVNFKAYAELTPAINNLSAKPHQPVGAKRVAKEQLKIEQMKWFASLSIKDYEKIRGKKLDFFGRVTFKMS